MARRQLIPLTLLLLGLALSSAHAGIFPQRPLFRKVGDSPSYGTWLRAGYFRSFEAKSDALELGVLVTFPSGRWYAGADTFSLSTERERNVRRTDLPGSLVDEWDYKMGLDVYQLKGGYVLELSRLGVPFPGAVRFGGGLSLNQVDLHIRALQATGVGSQRTHGELKHSYSRVLPIAELSLAARFSPVLELAASAEFSPKVDTTHDIAIGGLHFTGRLAYRLF